MTPDPERVMPKELQIHRLKEIFMSLNPDADPEVPDWEAFVSAKDSFDVNRVSLASHYRGYRWYPQEEISPEIKELREHKRTIRELEKRIKELEAVVPEAELDKLRAEVKKYERLSEERLKEIERLRRERPGVITREELRGLAESIGSSIAILSDRIKAIEETVKRPPAVEKIVVPTEERPPVDTTIYSTLDPIAHGKLIATWARELYNKEIHELTPEESKEVYNAATEEVKRAGKTVKVMPQVRDVLIQLTDRRGRYIFPASNRYWLTFEEFYPWWEQVDMKLYKAVIRDRIISMEDLLAWGLPKEWINSQLDRARDKMKKYGYEGV